MLGSADGDRALIVQGDVVDQILALNRGRPEDHGIVANSMANSMPESFHLQYSMGISGS